MNLTGHSDWRRKLHERLNPGASWASRVVWVKHGEHASGHAYRAVLRHPSDHDWTATLGKLASRLHMTPAIRRLQKAVDGEPKQDSLTGGRWITVHPNGEEDGHAVYIKPNPDGSHSIVAGAGGSLNGLRLDRIKPQAQYEQEARERRFKAEQEKKRQDAERAAQMTADEYKKDKEERKAKREEAVKQRVEVERGFVETAAKAHGVDPSTVAIPADAIHEIRSDARQKARDSGATQDDIVAAGEKAVAKAQERNHKEWVSWAKRSTDAARKVLHTEYDASVQQHLGDITAGAVTSDLTGDTGKGYSADVARMARDNGLTEPDIASAKRDVSWQGFLERAERNPKQAQSNRANVAKLQSAAAASREDAKEVDAKLAERGTGRIAAKLAQITPDLTVESAVELLKASQKMRAAQQAEREYKKALNEVDRAGQLPKAAIVEATELDDAEQTKMLAQALDSEHQSMAVANLVDASNDVEKRTGTLREHLSVGHSAAMSSIGGAIDGSDVDPMAIDLLGPNAVAQILVRKWRAGGMAGDVESNTKQALTDQHVETQEKIANDGVAIGQKLLDAAEAIPDVPLSDVEDIPAALALHEEKLDHIRMARQALGNARGRLEAAAAVNWAMRQKDGDSVISMGGMAIADVVQAMGALGLTSMQTYDDDGKVTKPGQYTVTHDGTNRIVRLHEAGQVALGKRWAADPEHVARLAQNAAIKNGEQDDDNWLPAGISSRPETTFDTDSLVYRDPDYHMAVSDASTDADMEQSIRHTVGQLMDAGAHPDSIIRNLSSASHVGGLGLGSAAETRYRQAFARVAPVFAAFDGGRVTQAAVRSEGMKSHRSGIQKSFTDMQRAYVAAEVASGRRDATEAPLDEQTIHDQNAMRDCIHVAVGKDPRRQHAYTPVGELGHEGLEAIRDYAYSKVFTNPDGSPMGRDHVTVLTPLSHTERRVYDKWAEWNGANTDPWSAIQKHMADNHDTGGGLFDEPAPVSPVATVDLHDPVALLKAARANPAAFGFHVWRGLPPEQATPELYEGTKYRADGSVDGSGEQTTEGIVQSIRGNVREKLREHFVRNVAGSGQAADSHFDPESVETSSGRWNQYVKDMGGPAPATKAIQELMQGEFVADVVAAHNARTGSKISVARRDLSDAARHATALTSPGHREELRKERARLAADARRRTKSEITAEGKVKKKGQFGEGSAAENVEASQAALGQHARIFGDTDTETITTVQRTTAGRAIDNAVASMVPNLQLGGPVSVAQNISMGGGKIAQQRAVKLILANKRQGLCLAAGSGKSVVGIGALTQAIKDGTAHKGLFVVPSNIVAQFGGEFYKFVDPEAGIRWHADPNASAAQRKAAYADANTHAVVVTPEALRQDVTNLVASSQGWSYDDTVAKMQDMKAPEVDKLVHGAMDAAGWNADFMFGDESHRMLDRKGKPDSHMARISDSIGRRASHYVYSSADPVKNDVSEAWSVLNKINPKRFPDGSQDAFLRRYGRSTASSKMALQRELGSAIYTHAVQTGVEHDRTDHELKMTGDQMKQYKDRVDAYRQARSAWAHGKVDVEACKRLMPHSYKPGMTADEEKHLAERHSRALGTIRDAALNQVVNLHPEGAKVAWTEKYLTEHKGEPTVIFAHNLKAVDMIAERLTKSGHRVAKIKGDMDSGTKDDAKNAFSPAAGEATADVLVSSDAGAVGANLQRGAHQINYDIPVTAMLHEQRIARTVRMGQKNRVQVHNLAADCPVERNARRVLRTKGELRELVTASEESIDDSGLGMRLKRANAMTLNNLYGGSGK